MAPCESAPQTSSGTSCSSCAASSERRRMKPTCGPLPWVTTTFQPSLIIARMWREGSCAARYWSITVSCLASLISELPPIATTPPLPGIPLSFSAPGQAHNGLLAVQPVLGLVVHDRPRAVDDLVGHLDPAVGRQRVHEHSVVAGQ